MLTNSRWCPRRFAGVLLPVALTALACSSGASPSGAGGSSGSGGKPATGSGGTSTGGATGSSGGVTGTGGMPGGTGGASGSGGTGGASSGGTVGSGGNGSGGNGSGGNASGGSASGGVGGKTSSGGTSAGGAAGTGDAGASGHAGAGGHATGGAGGASTNCAGQAISFNMNTAANNDPAKAAVMVAFNGSADLPLGNANRTIEFWAYLLTSSWSADANTLFFYGTNNRKADGFGLDFGATMNGTGTIDPFTNAIFDNDNQSSGLSTSTNQWAHFAMTWDGTTVRAYVNGVMKASKASSGSTLMTGMSDLVIGGYPPAFFNGRIDEFRVWNVARSAAEITSTMSHTLVGNEPGLTGYWKFDEVSGTTASDSVTSAGHTPHPGMLSADKAADNPTFVASTAPLACP